VNCTGCAWQLLVKVKLTDGAGFTSTDLLVVMLGQVADVVITLTVCGPAVFQRKVAVFWLDDPTMVPPDADQE